MSRDDGAPEASTGSTNPLLSPLKPNIATPTWRRLDGDQLDKGNGHDSTDGFELDAVIHKVQKGRKLLLEEEEDENEDTSDEAILRRHNKHAIEERKRWLPVEDEKKPKSPGTKKRQKLRLSVPIFPTPLECYHMIMKSVEKEGGPQNHAPPNGNDAGENGLMEDRESVMGNGSGIQRNGSAKDHRMIITTESFKRLQDVLSREKDYFNRVLNGLEKCIRENEPSIAIHTDVDRKVVFSQEDFEHLIRNVKYSFESINSLQILLRERSEGLKKEEKRIMKLNRTKTVRNGKQKPKASLKKKEESLVPTNYNLQGV